MENYDHRRDIEALEDAIGYAFDDRALLNRALTHRSFTNEHDDIEVNNQRLEFLGDAVLGMVIADALFWRFPDVEEGSLSSLSAQLVCEPALVKIAITVKLGEFLRLGRGESLSGGRSKSGNLADAYEALLASIYLDGGLQAVRGVILTLHSEALDEANVAAAPEDYKSELQRRVQSAQTPPPAYVTVDAAGPDHAKVFVAEVAIDGEPVARGEGRSKKEAEQCAAANALELLERERAQEA